ncbi:hypothetical protein RRG08_041112 [Elysia crispata]|uniref:Uncharacterized protein n=1 Tax=Elysia crispata TaxID=231223 RepID=A0AAE0XYG0_9GAST|nr:hypothetical protein RRG08_041112 [Elysia crispata]
MMVPKDLMIWTMFVAKRVNLILQNDDHESLLQAMRISRPGPHSRAYQAPSKGNNLMAILDSDVLKPRHYTVSIVSILGSQNLFLTYQSHFLVDKSFLLP